MSDLEFGLRITVLGMGIVFGMLLLLWGLLTLALRFEGAGEPAQDAAAAAAPAAGAGGTTPGPSLPAPDAGGRRVALHSGAGPEGAAVLDPVVVAAVTIAVIRHAEARRLQAAPAMRSYWPGSLLFASRWVAAGRMRQGQSWRRRSR